MSAPRFRVLSALLLALASACAPTLPIDPGLDAGTALDAGTEDAGTGDAGTGDAGTSTSDAGPPADGGTGPAQDGGTTVDGGMDGTNDAGPPPAALAGMRVSAGSTVSCEVYDTPDSPGHLRCWGDRRLIERAPTTGGFVHVSAAGAHVCALREDGTGACFDESQNIDIPSEGGPYAAVHVTHNGVCLLNLSGALTCFDGLFTAPLMRAVPTENLRMFSHFADAYRDYLCVLDSDDTVHCDGEMVDGPFPVPGDLGAQKAVSVGDFAACALDDAGSIRCWGERPPAIDAAAGPFVGMDLGSYLCAWTEAGVTSCWDASGEREPDPALQGSTQVSVGYASSAARAHLCGVQTDSPAICGGWSVNGANRAPAQVGVIAEGRAAYQFACVRSTDGRVSCSTEALTPPADLPPMAQIDVGTSIACGRTEAGIVHCWGEHAPAESLQIPRFLDAASSIAVSNGRVCILNQAGRVRCWGSLSDNGSRPPSSAGYVQINLDGQTACGRKASGQTYCWGYNATRMTQAPSGLSSTDLACGTHHACAITPEGTVQCWGDNDNGQTDVPEGLTGIIDIAVGGDTSCALRADGQMQCWGEYATIRDGGLPSVAISVAERNLCGLSAQGSFTCGARSGGSATFVSEAAAP